MSWMQRSSASRKQDKKDYIYCSPRFGGCGYGYTWRSKSECFGCGRCLAPSPAASPQPKGRWKDGHPQSQQPPPKQAAGIGGIGDLKSAASKLLGEDSDTFKVLAEALESHRQAAQASKPVWVKSQIDQKELEKKKKQLEGNKQYVEKLRGEMEATRLKIEETERRQGELELEVKTLTERIQRTGSVLKGDIDLDVLLPGLAQPPADADPELVEAFGEAKKAFDRLRAAVKAKRPKESEDDEEEEQQEDRRGERDEAEQPQEAQPKPLATEMEVDSEMVDELVRQLVPDFGDKPEAERADIKQKALGTFARGAKRIKTTPPCS